MLLSQSKVMDREKDIKSNMMLWHEFNMWNKK
jgi:hypothetical protein